MRTISPIDGALAYPGALDLEATPDGVRPRRLPAWTRPQIPDLVMDAIVGMPSGVRIRLATDASALELDVMLTHVHLANRERRPARFDLVADGQVVATAETFDGDLITVTGPGPADLEFAPGGPTTVAFADVPAGAEVLEVWLPQGTGTEVRAVRVPDDATVADAPPAATGRRWVHHGSSISHCLEADGPTGTWPAVAALQAGVELTNLGFGGQCMLDPFVARTIRDLPADVISCKLGINIVNGDTMRERTFVPAVHGFLDTIREGHPDTPILVGSPIVCPPAETVPGPTLAGADGRYGTVTGSDEIRVGCLTLERIRTLLAQVVEQRRALGDEHLTYLDGLELFGPADAGDLYDDLHPEGEGYVRIGHRFAERAFAPGGPLAAH